MPANVETMFYTREKPWHGLGIRVESALNSQEALVAAGLDWKVIQKPITTSDGCLIPGFKANIRDRDQQILGWSRTVIRWFKMKMHLLLQISYWEKVLHTRPLDRCRKDEEHGF